MYGSELCVFSFWWIVPVVMMVLCFLMMKGHRGAMMCGFGSRISNRHPDRGADSALAILDRRYASGAIDRAEYEEKKRVLVGPVDPENDRASRPEDK